MISNAVTPQLISNFVFATLVVQSLLVLNPKCHASTKPSSVVEQPVLCQTGRSPQGFPSFLSFLLGSLSLFELNDFFYDKLNQLLKILQDINDGFVFIYIFVQVTKCVVYSVGINLCRCQEVLISGRATL